MGSTQWRRQIQVEYFKPRDFGHNFGKYRPSFTIILLTDSQVNYLCNYYRVFHLTLTVLQN